MKFLYFNHAYGTNCKSLDGFLRTHFYHARGLPEKVREKSNIKATLDLIHQVSPDVFAISEVLGETQRKEFIQSLQPSYTLHFGQGHRIGESDQYVEILLGTKSKSTKVSIPTIELPAKCGYGGGIVAAKLNGTYIVAAQLGKPNDVFAKQLDVVRNIIKDRKKVIVMGDFNREFDGELPLERYSLNEDTCSTTTVIKWFYRRSIDYILGKGFNVVKSSVVEGVSDHKAVVVELEN